MAAAKTLGESYEGCLSRDWEKLLDILEAGGKRVLILESSKDNRHYTSSDVYMGPTKAGFLESHCIGWFPTKEDLPLPAVEPSTLEWSHYHDGTALASEGDWRFYADDYGDWSIKLNGIVVVQAYEKGTEPPEGYMDSAKAAIHEWRVDHINSMIKK